MREIQTCIFCGWHHKQQSEVNEDVNEDEQSEVNEDVLLIHYAYDTHV